jgi:hypothetical protein
MKRRKLIFCISAYNMAYHLRKCVESIKPYADRIIVVEGRFGEHWRSGANFATPHSVDGTAEVAQQLGCEVIRSHDLVQHQQRDLYLKGVEGDVYFVIDADMTLEGTLGKQGILYGDGNVWSVQCVDPDGHTASVLCVNRHLNGGCSHSVGGIRLDGAGRLMDGTYPNHKKLMGCWLQHYNMRGEPRPVTISENC